MYRMPGKEHKVDTILATEGGIIMTQRMLVTR